MAMVTRLDGGSVRWFLLLTVMSAALTSGLADRNANAAGACCYEQVGNPQILCVEIDETICDVLLGTFYGEGTTCDGIQCPSACCLSDFTCTLLTEADCALAGGRYQGDDVPCESIECDAFGACCLSDGTCSDTVTYVECVGLGGTYRGHGTVCGGDTCDGACCFGTNCVDNLTRFDMIFLYAKNNFSPNHQSGQISTGCSMNIYASR